MQKMQSATAGRGHMIWDMVVDAIFELPAQSGCPNRSIHRQLISGTSKQSEMTVAPDPMLDTIPSIVPPAPPIHPKDLPPVRLPLGSIRNSLAIWPDYAFDVAFNRNTLFGIESAFVNDPAGVRHIMATNAANYVRPAMTPRISRALIGRGLFLAESSEWRRQRRLLSPSFTPHHVDILLPHFIAAANDVVRELEGQPSVDLSATFQIAALNAVLRALFSMPDQGERDRIGVLVRQYVTGPGRPQIFDAFAKSETSFA